jgi:hypothetical protein
MRLSTLPPRLAPHKLGLSVSLPADRIHPRPTPHPRPFFLFFLSSRAELDEDLPAHGQHYCAACSRYFVSPEALTTHERSKPHRR